MILKIDVVLWYNIVKMSLIQELIEKDKILKEELKPIFRIYHLKWCNPDHLLYKIEDNIVTRIPGLVQIYIGGDNYQNNITVEQNGMLLAIMKKYNVIIVQMVATTSTYIFESEFNCPYGTDKDICEAKMKSMKFVDLNGNDILNYKGFYHGMGGIHSGSLVLSKSMSKLYVNFDVHNIEITKNDTSNYRSDKLKILLKLLPLFESRNSLKSCIELIIEGNDIHVNSNYKVYYDSDTIDLITSMICKSGLKKIVSNFNLQNHINIPDVVIV